MNFVTWKLWSQHPFPTPLSRHNQAGNMKEKSVTFKYLWREIFIYLRDYSLFFSHTLQFSRMWILEKIPTRYLLQVEYLTRRGTFNFYYKSSAICLNPLKTRLDILSFITEKYTSDHKLTISNLTFETHLFLDLRFQMKNLLWSKVLYKFQILSQKTVTQNVGKLLIRYLPSFKMR